jgi:hypothetical protein
MQAHERDTDVDGHPGPTLDRRDTAEVDTPTQAAVAESRSTGLRPEQVSQLQRVAGNSSVTSLLRSDDEESPVRKVVQSGGGQSLDRDTQQLMESKLGHDFSSVRVHTDREADRSAESVQAQAYTVGENVVFRSGKYDPSSSDGRKTLAHELTHVVQQRSGPVDGQPAAGGIRVSTPGDPYEQEADATAAAVMRSTDPPVESHVQRQADEGEEEEEVQAQRQADEGEEEEEVQAQRQADEGEEEEEEEGTPEA